MLPNQFAAIIRFHRKKSGLSQAELAMLAGLGKTVIFDIEKGKQSIRFDTLLKVMKVLNITIQFQSPLMNLFYATNTKEIIDEKS
jgi:y4mF family transcriptional regulator